MHEAQSSSPGIHYVCIATAQNSVNILPLFTESRYQIKNIKQVTILTSEKGKVKLWTDLLEAFLNDHCQKVDDGRLQYSWPFIGGIFKR